MGAPRRTLATNLTEIVRRVTSAQIDVVLVEVPGGAIVDRYLGVYAAAAKRFHTSLIGESLLRRLFAFSQLYTIDGTHLNARGHAAVAKRLSRVLRKTYGVR
jgi:lysophospholipase L1-like esterase